jgi:hypothetical protein
MANTPRTPPGLGTSGKRLWKSVLAEYDLQVHEEILLLEAARCADRLDRLAEEASKGPVTQRNFKGDEIAHPAMVEARQQGAALSRLLASLRLPSGDEGNMSRPQRRGAARGSYGIRGVV